VSTTTYLDHAATTSVLPEVVAVVSAAMAELGNASSTHGPGRRARSTVEESREDIADALGVHPSEVVFTSGGTESDNIAVTGTFLARRAADPARTRVVTTGLEHHAVLDSVEHLVADQGALVTWVEPSAEGIVTPEALRAALDEGAGPADVAVVSVMWANN
jgi:cysteine desulfurase